MSHVAPNQPRPSYDERLCLKHALAKGLPLTSSWEQIEAQAQTKFAQAKSVLDEQQELLRQEEEQISQIAEKVNALKLAEKAQLLEQLRQQAAAEGVEVQA